MTALVTLAAVLLDALLGEPPRWHPLVGFGRWAQYFERRLNTNTIRSPLTQRLLGILAVVAAVGPWVLFAYVATVLPALHYWVALAALYFALGHQSLRQHAQRVQRALEAGNLIEARAQVGYMVSRDTVKMDARGVAAAAVESVL